MSKENVMVHIPKPCHEDWQQMTPVAQGRFCQSCAKQVVDFSLMTDQQVLQHISKAAGGLCGRFAADQLQRPLLPVKPEKKKMWWLAAAVPLMMGLSKAGAQKKITNPKAFSIPEQQMSEVMGKVKMPNKITLVDDTIINTAKEIKGKVVNDKGAVLPFATVRVIDHPISTMVDSAGEFTLKFHSYTDSIEIEASAIGYGIVNIRVAQDEQDIVISLKEVENKLPDVVVTDNAPVLCGMTAGGISIIKTTSYEKSSAVNKITDTLVKCFFKNQSFTIYPNPAQRGQSINIDTKKEGYYSIQVFNNDGKLLQVKEFNATVGATQTAFGIPATFTSGMYYIRLVDEKTKKQCTDKIVVR